MDHPLTERQKLILALIIREYAQNAQPVGSSRLMEEYNLDFSSATIRNEMSTLSDMGYLKQPHTSAGRTPTEEGYRFFVSQLMGQNDLPGTTKRTIVHQFYQAREGVDQWLHLAASILAKQSQAASLVTSPHTPSARFKHLELINIRGRQVLMVLVLVGGEIRQQMLNLSEPISQAQLSATAQDITLKCQGYDIHNIDKVAGSLDVLGHDIIKLVKETLDTSNRSIAGSVYRDGLINILAEPEFSEPETARKALRVLEERSFLESLLSQTIMRSDIGDVQVLIGGEGTWEELSDCSIVMARYGVNDIATGMVGVVGPIRMRYGRSISAVKFISELLSELIIDVQEE